MSWGEVFKINSNMKKPLDEQLKDVNSDMSIPLNELLRVPRLLVYDNSGTFTAPVTGWYLITCIGKGGDGGKAYNAATYTRGYGGGGGGEKYDGDSKTSTGNGGTGGAGCVIIEYYE